MGPTSASCVMGQVQFVLREHKYLIRMMISLGMSLLFFFLFFFYLFFIFDG